MRKAQWASSLESGTGRSSTAVYQCSGLIEHVCSGIPDRVHSIGMDLSFDPCFTPL